MKLQSVGEKMYDLQLHVSVRMICDVILSESSKLQKNISKSI